MDYVVVIVVGIISSVVGSLFVYRLKTGASGSSENKWERLTSHIEVQKQLIEKIDAMYSTMVSIDDLRNNVQEWKRLREELRMLQSRRAVSDAELETVEARLRELEEIERELEASSIETKEELRVLQRKETELRGKNEELKGKIAETTADLEKLVQEVEMTSQLQDQIFGMKTELYEIEEKSEKLISQIEEGNARYFTLKQRYDALDIEYAQLYERLGEAETSQQ